jgi:hypothetical protein
MKISKFLFITVVGLILAIAPAEAINYTSVNNTAIRNSGFRINYTPGSSVHPNTKTVRVQGFNDLSYNRNSNIGTPCTERRTAGTRIAGRRPVYPYYRVPVVRTLGAVHVGSNSRSATNGYYDRYYSGYGGRNNVYINNNGNVYIH